MMFTAIHRALGCPAGPLTIEMLDEAVDAGLAESGDLDWKQKLADAKDLTQSDYPKDIAAMANSGGGLIIFGVHESQKCAIRRSDVGELSEVRERALRSVAVTAITPPIFNLGIYLIGEIGDRALALEVPASVDAPHMIYRGGFFGAPVRNDADTVWLRERDIAAMYQTRFNELRFATDALDALSSGAAVGRDAHERAWLVAAARPRVPRSAGLSRDRARELLGQAHELAHEYASGVHPLDNVDRLNPRVGLRRWSAVNSATSEAAKWRESWIDIHRDGSVTLATAIGGHRVVPTDYLPGNRIDSSAVECAVADLMALVRTTAAATANREYEARVSVDWSGEGALVMCEADPQWSGYEEHVRTPIRRFTPVETMIRPDADTDDFQCQMYDLALDCLNQGGASAPATIRLPASSKD